MKDPAIGFADSLRVGNQHRVQHRRKSQAVQLPTLHSNGAVRDQAKLHAACAKRRQRAGRIREQHAGTWESSAVVAQQSLRQGSGKLEPRQHAGEQFSPRTIPVAVEFYQCSNVLLPIYHLEDVSKALPLIVNKPLEASTTVEQGSIQIEDHGMNVG
jgi:hypothetical protein